MAIFLLETIHAFAHLVSRSTDRLCSGLTLPGYLCGTEPWELEMVSPCGGTGQPWMANAHYRRLSFPNSCFLFCNTTHCTPLRCWYKNSNNLGTADAVDNKLSFVSFPGVSCFLPSSMKWWQVNCYFASLVKSQSSSRYFCIPHQ